MIYGYNGGSISFCDGGIRLSAPLFSVVVPAYNQHKFINSCLKSLQSQTVTDFEVFVVDDCSTDDTAEQIAAFAARDNRFHLVAHTHNRGVSAARNSGMARAHGQYLCFIDGDDWVDPNFLANFQAAYRDHPGSQLVICDHYGYLSVPSKSKVYNQKQLIDNINFGTVGGFAWNKCFIREIITNHQLKFNETIDFLEDQLFAFQYANYVHQAPYIAAKTYHYRWRFRSNLAHFGIPFFVARRKMLKLLKQQPTALPDDDLK